MGVGGQHHAPAALPPGRTQYPLYGRLMMNLLLNCLTAVSLFCHIQNWRILNIKWILCCFCLLSLWSLTMVTVIKHLLLFDDMRGNAFLSWPCWRRNCEFSDRTLHMVDLHQINIVPLLQ